MLPISKVKLDRVRLFIAVGLLSCSLISGNPNLGAQRRVPGQEDPHDRTDHDVQAKMEKERRDGEWNKLKEDAGKLFQVVSELKEMVEKSNKDTFSLQILKKADEAEKVLKDVKRRAKEGF